jgi:membrane protein DedA with SNARE-associated domain/membrane-associated phospholipid phosphatase
LESHLQALIDYFSADPHIALGAIFAASLLESLAVIGTVIPGSSIVFVGGVLIGLNAINPWWTAAAAVSGAILGDGISYWLGRHYQEKIRAIWPMRNYPGLFARGHAYFARNGGRSVFLGRFIGPVRAVVPVIAGMANMPPLQFYAVNIVSALAWVAAHIIPGALFGASLQLAGAVSSRLVIMLVVIAAILWGISKLVRFSYNRGWPRIKWLRDRAVERARGKSGLHARIVISLFDPASAGSKTFLIASVLLIGSIWLFFGILEDVVSKDPLIQLDQSVYALLQGLRNEWGDSLMVTVSGLGGAAGTVPVIAVVSLWFIYKRYWRTLGYWLAAVGFAQILVWILKYTLGYARPHDIDTGLELLPLPSGHLALSIVVYGFMVFLMARGKPVWIKTAITLLVATAVILLVFSRLYLGIHWLSDVLASLSLGLAWVALLSIAYTHRVYREPVSTLLLLPVVLALALGGAWYVGNRQDADLARYASLPTSKIMPFEKWKTEGWRSLPFARSELGGEIEEPFSLQWLGTSGQIAGILAAAGWQAAEPWAVKSALLWLLPNTTIGALPVLPKFDHGKAQKLTFVKIVNPQERVVVRLWPRRYAIDAVEGGSSRPLWNGTVTFERLRHPVGITLVKSGTDFNTASHVLEQDIKSQRLSTENRERSRVSVVLVW